MDLSAGERVLVDQVVPRAFIGTEEVAKRMGVKKSWLYDGADRVGVPSYKVGNKRLYVWEEVAAWIVDPRRFVA